jgi:UDP-N-acetylmuramoyl-tripeptide--D-alanyl-D-alanine ligase
MKAAIENFAHLQGEKKIVVLGGMMELGESSIKEHTNILNLLLKYAWYKVVLVGEDYINVPDNFMLFKSSSSARDWFQNQHFENSLILIKGSRSMQMEKVIE